jgi:hypothetical protein
MKPEQEFDQRMAAIHALGQPAGKAVTADVRHEEFSAMFDAFLGKQYDAAKRKQVEDLQVALHQQDVELQQRLQVGELNAEQYVDASNAVMEETARKCEAILGPADFEKLFGATRAELTGMIEGEAFRADRKNQSS